MSTTNDDTKPVHGQSKPEWQRLGLRKLPPAPCAFSVGDIVIYTNDQGCEFQREVIGFADEAGDYGRFIHLNNDCWWAPVAAKSLAIVSGSVVGPAGSEQPKKLAGETTRHTPGPWNAVRSLDGAMAIWDPLNRLVAKTNKVDALDCRLGSPTLPDCIEANARLIAAAPELLAALRDAENKIRMMQGNPHWEAIAQDIQHDARAAIAKASAAV